ncbi:MAG: hypothetical protein ACYC2G_16280 [Gemmatimonadaceae bacterium]
MRTSRPLRTTVLAAFALPTLALGGDIQAQELRYTLTPTAQWVKWDDELGIDDAYLYGGRAGFSFGQFIELQGYYLNRGRINTHFDRIGLDLVDTARRSLDIQNYGADIVVNLSPTQLKPFIRAGGSLLRFKPENGEATRQIALRYGGGIRFGNPGQLQLQLYAEDLLFRVDRNRLAGVPVVTPDPDASKLRHNLAYGAGLTVPLGGATSGDDRPSYRLGNVSIPVEPFGGVFNFDDDLDLDGQNVAGVRTGLDFGPLVGLRGYYWRGVDDGFSELTGVQSWGGEAQFRLNAGSGLNPYLIAGAGQLDFRSDYDAGEADAGGSITAPVDRTMLILGGGVSLELSQRLRLNVAARDHLFNAEGDVEDASRADDLSSNWMFTAGLGFNIGGSTRGPDRQPPEPVVVSRVDTVLVDVTTGDVVREVRGTDSTARLDTARVHDRDMARDERAARTSTSGGSDGYVSGRTIQLPVPTEGELHVRYGPARDSTPRMDMTRAGGMPANDSATDEATRRAMREILRDELERSGRMADTVSLSNPDARELFERRLLDRIDSAVTARMNAGRAAPRNALTTPGGVTTLDAESERRRLLSDIETIVRTQVQREMERQESLRPRPAPVVTPPAYTPPPAPEQQQQQRWLSPRSFSLYTGLNVNQGAQFVLGGRINVGPITRNLPRLALVPEFAIGLGDGTTTLLAANGQYRLDPLGIGGFGDVAPYGQLGLGAYVGTLEGDRQLKLMLNPGYGLEFTLDDNVRRTVGTSLLFVEHQGLQFFKRNRFVVGLRWPL